jgi:hypothetical protein
MKKILEKMYHQKIDEYRLWKKKEKNK